MSYLNLTDAANFLNVSEEYLIKLLNDGTLPFEYAIDYRSLERYKAKRDRERHEALIRLTEMSVECGGYNWEDA